MSERWKLTSHARMRAAEMGLDRSDVLEVIKKSKVTWEGTRDGEFDSPRRVYAHEDIAVVTDDADRMVITVLYHVEEVYERPAKVMPPNAPG